MDYNEISAELLAIIMIIGMFFSILSLILFFKVWGMCNDVDAIMRKVTASPSKNYHWSDNFTLKTFNKDIEEVKELIFCERTVEARQILKRLQYHLMLEEQNRQYSGMDKTNFDTQVATVKELLEKIS